MNLIDYAKYLLNVCGKRFTHLYQRHYLDSTPALPSLSALLSYLKTQTASIYTHLFSRGCTQSTTTFANLLPTLHQLDTRKVEEGGVGNITDGQQLLPLIVDQTMRRNLGNIDDYSITSVTMPYAFRYMCYDNTIRLNNLLSINAESGFNGCLAKVIDLPNMTSINSFSAFYGCNRAHKILLPKWASAGNWNDSNRFAECTELRELNIEGLYNFGRRGVGEMSNCNKLILIKFRNNIANNYGISPWHPTEAMSSSSTSLIEEGETYSSNLEKFLHNFIVYLVDRLNDGNNTLLLSLHSTVYNAISVENTYSEGVSIMQYLTTVKHWRVESLDW